jgi:hypothetical protein
MANEEYYNFKKRRHFGAGESGGGWVAVVGRRGRKTWRRAAASVQKIARTGAARTERQMKKCQNSWTLSWKKKGKVRMEDVKILRTDPFSPISTHSNGAGLQHRPELDPFH